MIKADIGHIAENRHSGLKAAVRCGCMINEQTNVSFGLVLFFPYRSARIVPLLATPFMACNGGGWIVLGLVVRDRFRV